MELSKIDQLIQREILDGSDLAVIGIDQTDIDNFKAAHSRIDARMAVGRCEDLAVMFDCALTEMRCDNAGAVSGLLFVVKVSPGNVTLRADFMGGITESIDKLGSDLDCVWGMLRDASLEPDQAKVILLAGF
jgi:hypothetical protein